MPFTFQKLFADCLMNNANSEILNQLFYHLIAANTGSCSGLFIKNSRSQLYDDDANPELIEKSIALIGQNALFKVGS